MSFAVVKQVAPNKPPIMEEGEITPKVLARWHTAVRAYCNHKGIPEDERVMKVAYGMVDPRVQDWLEEHEAELALWSVAEYMAALREEFLEKDWANDICYQLMNFRQGTQAFKPWYLELLALRSLLQGTAFAYNNAQLRSHIDANMSRDLRNMCVSANNHAVADYDTWIENVKLLDERVRAENERIQAQIAAERNRVKAQRGVNIATGRVTTENTSTTKSEFPPPLTDTERTLLFEHDGCTKCRKPWQNHLKATCPNPWPKKSNVKTLTKADMGAPPPGFPKSRRAKVAHGVAVNHVGEGSSTTVTASASVVQMPNNIVDSEDSSEYVAPLHTPHLLWRCALDAAQTVIVDALIDDGSHTVLIDEAIAARLELRRRKLPSPLTVRMAMGGDGRETTLYDYVRLRPSSLDSAWTSKTLRAIVAPGLAAPVILGMPFLAFNQIVIDHESRQCTTKETQYTLLAPPSAPYHTSSRHRKQIVPKQRVIGSILAKQAVVRELKDTLAERKREYDARFASTWRVDTCAVLREAIDRIGEIEEFRRLDAELKSEFADRFPMDIPHIDHLPPDVMHRFRLKDPSKTLRSGTYSTPRKYREHWHTLIQQHTEAGRIRPSNSPYSSPAFLIPKADPSALPRWVNDYRKLNDNTVPDAYPLPRVEQILADCAKGKIWAKLDMTNSFFQTRVHPDDVPLTAVQTPLGLYEWLVMPMGCRNAPATHQRRMFMALREHIGRICHVYIDDIIIWSNSIEEHIRNVRTILNALKAASLFVSKKKTQLFCRELHFLGHKISRAGIEADENKAAKIDDWPQPKSATEVRSFLGLVRYVASFLPKLADFTRVLTPLTMKEADREFPPWSSTHQRAFDGIKQLVTSRECLTTIDHDNPGENQIFVTCDASDWRTGAVLSFGPTWETARPVAYDSIQLKGAELNYPVHEKELLAIVRALKKWRFELLGTPFKVFTDHRTLTNFAEQRDLSRRQARWQELLAQYDFEIVYVPGEKNTVADALSRLPAEPPTVCASTLTITVADELLEQIRQGYKTDNFARKLLLSPQPQLGIQKRNGLIYIGDRLLVPRVSDLRQTLFHLAHDALGHFGNDKSYEALRSEFYWPNMRTDLEQSYIASCEQCQRNKSLTRKPAGPLHPLPVPDGRGDSVAIDFVGPLPKDHGYNAIVTMTDRLGADIRIAPTRTDISAEQFAVLFFDVWYCENGLPLEIVSDRDKLFVSKFWRALTKLTGVKLKMSTAFHPQTDGASERTNKTVIQALRYHVDRSQKGWVRALPRVRFDIMNTVNASTGYSPFMLRMGRSPRLIPPFEPSETTAITDKRLHAFLRQIELDEFHAKDNLLLAKISQAIQSDKNSSYDPHFNVGDFVMLNTLHRRRDYIKKGDNRVAKFMPRWDGKYKIVRAYPDTSTYTIELPNNPQACPTFHASELKLFRENDAELFPSREHPKPGPVVTADGEEEWFIDSVIDEKRGRGRGAQMKYLVRWQGYGDDANSWLSRSDLEETAALDAWLKQKASL